MREDYGVCSAMPNDSDTQRVPPRGSIPDREIAGCARMHTVVCKHGFNGGSNAFMKGMKRLTARKALPMIFQRPSRRGGKVSVYFSLRSVLQNRNPDFFQIGHNLSLELLRSPNDGRRLFRPLQRTAIKRCERTRLQVIRDPRRLLPAELRQSRIARRLKRPFPVRLRVPN